MTSAWALLGIAIFAIINIAVVVLVANASAKASAPPAKRPEEEMAAFLEESLAFARSLRAPGADDARPEGPTADRSGGEASGEPAPPR